MSKPTVYGFCDAGCKWEVPHKDEVMTIEVLENYSKLTDRNIKIDTSYLYSTTDIWNNADAVEIDLTNTPIGEKPLDQLLAISGTIEIKLKYAGYDTNEDMSAGDLYFLELFTDVVPFNCLYYDVRTNGTRIIGKKFNIPYTRFVDDRIFNINLQVEYLNGNLYITSISVGKYDLTTTPTSKYSDGGIADKYNGEEEYDYVPEIRIKSLNFFYV